MTAHIVNDDGSGEWRTQTRRPQKITEDVYALLVKLGQGRKIVVTEWVDFEKTERWKKAQALRDALEWKLNHHGDGRKITLSVRAEGEVWIAWRLGQ